MTWVKLDDAFYRNPKARAAGPLGRELYIAGLCHCAAQLTDGRIEKALVPILIAEAEAKPSTPTKLLELGLWLDDEDAYVVNDYLAWNPSAEAVRARRDQRAAAGKRGGQQSGKSRRSKDEANASANGKQDGSESEANANPGPGPLPGTDALEGLPPVTEGRFGVGSPEGQDSLIRHWCDAWCETHGQSSLPPASWHQTLRRHFRNDFGTTPYADMELIVGWMGRDGKDPKHLPLVVSDFYKDKQAGAV